MAVCRNYLKVAYTQTGPKTALFTRLRCKQWSCEYCAAKNAAMWQYWLIKRIPEVGGRWWLVTLTASSKTRGEWSSLENLRRGIDTLIKRLRRVFPDVQYVRVFEVHPSSVAVHAHFIMANLENFIEFYKSKKGVKQARGVAVRKGRKGTWSLKTWFKKTACELKMGYMADAQEFAGDMTKAAFYVTKYLTKEQGKIKVKYLRHVQVSAGIGSPEFEKSYEWTPASFIVQDMFPPKTVITDVDNGFVIEHDRYWQYTSFYPHNEHDAMRANEVIAHVRGLFEASEQNDVT